MILEVNKQMVREMEIGIAGDINKDNTKIIEDFSKLLVLRERIQYLSSDTYGKETEDIL